MSAIVLRNRQRVRRINTPLLRRIVTSLLAEVAGQADHELCIHLIGAPEMARINQQYLQHEGSTDVITFDHSLEQLDSSSSSDHPEKSKTTTRSRTKRIYGEIFICLDDTLAQARQFRTTWQSELTRYVVHGILHLLGHEDLKPAARRKMKQAENLLVRSLAARFPLSQLARKSKLHS
jgi:probable rRNA maturation factor